MPIYKCNFCWQALLTLLLCIPLISSAGGIPEGKVKAAFVYNFIKLVKPVKPLADDYTLCILGESSVNLYLKQLNRQTRHGTPIKVVTIIEGNNSPICNGLFIGEVTNSENLKPLLRHAEKNGILTITDTFTCFNLGSIFYLKQLQGRLRFDVNLLLAQQADFKLDANLLRLAHIVKR